MNKQDAKARFDLLLQQQDKQRQQFLDTLPKELRDELEQPIKKVDKLDTFMANGTKYTVRTSLAIERFQEFERLQVKVGFGVDFMALITNLKKAYNAANAGKIGDTAVLLHNMMNTITAKVDERLNPVLILCTLFISRDGEDLTTYDATLAESKIGDWKKEGIDMADFFQFAFSSVDGFMPFYNEALANISAQIAEAKASVKGE